MNRLPKLADRRRCQLLPVLAACGGPPPGGPGGGGPDKPGAGH
jgi:hypothetical protein